MWLIYPISQVEKKNLLPLSNCVSVAHSFLVRDVSPCPPPPLRAVNLSSLNLCRSRVSCPNLWVHMCVWNTLLSYNHLSPLDLAIFLLLLYRWLGSEGRGLTKTFHLGLRAQISHSLHNVQLWVHVNFNLMHQEASLWIVKGTDLCV